MMVTAAVSADMDERESESVCLQLEKRRSTDTLTAGIMRMSRAMRERMGKVELCC